jgi:hypothetical protein
MNRGVSRKAQLQRAWAPFYLGRLARVLKPSDRVLVEGTLSEYATSRCPELEDVREVAKHRMESLYMVLPEVPPDLWHAVGWWMDTHIPVILSSATTVRKMYQTELAPEQNYDFPPCAATELVWHVWLPHSDNLSPSATAAVKLLKKGSVSPPSIRYISSQLARCAEMPGAAETTVRAIVLLHVLGLYVGRKMIVTPEKRIELYRMPTSELLGLVSKCGSRELYCIVATYVVWSTRLEHPLWVFCQKTHRRYTKTIMNLGLEYGQKITIDMSKQCMMWRHISTYDMFVSALEVRKKLPVWVQENIVDIERCARTGATGRAITAGLLRQAGMSVESISKLVVSVSSKPAAALVLESIPIEDRARLYVVLLTRASRAELRIGRLSSIVTDAQRKACLDILGEPDTFSSVCMACSTWRHKSRSIRGLSKATSGVVVDYPNDCLRCNACHAGWSVAPVSMVGQIVFAKLRLTGPSVPFVLCVGCAQPAHPVTFIGCLPYCHLCRVGARERISAPGFCAVCDLECRSGGETMDCKTRGGQRAVITACPRHASACRDLGPARCEDGIAELRSNLGRRYKPHRPGQIRTSYRNGSRRRR